MKRPPRDTAREMSEEDVEKIRKGIEAFNLEDALEDARRSE